jgi:hypothetical protein
MEGPEREEPSGALPVFDGEAHPHPLQEVSDASAPLSAPLKARREVRFEATSGRIMCRGLMSALCHKQTFRDQ